MDLLFTATEQRILTALSDGQMHTPDELRSCLNDELCGKSVVSTHVCCIRRKLKRKGEDIVCRVHFRRTYYQHVRLIANEE